MSPRLLSQGALTSGMAGWRATSHRVPAAAALGYHGLGLVQRGQGRLEAALATYREALAVAAEPDGHLRVFLDGPIPPRVNNATWPNDLPARFSRTARRRS